MEPMFERSMIGEINTQAIDEDKREVPFIAATEAGVRGFFGMEHIVMKGMDLKRFKTNPVLVNAHNRQDTRNVIGKVKDLKKEEGGLLTAVAVFAETDMAEEIWQLVKGGFVKAFSVGFRPLQTKFLDEGEEKTVSGKTIEGPAELFIKSELFEISSVPVGADAEALVRGAMLGSMTVDQARSVKIVLDRFITEKENGMEDTRTAEEIAAEEQATTETDGDEQETLTPIEQAPAPDTTVSIKVKTAQVESERKQAIYDITPRGLEAVADECVADGLDIDASREKIKAELAKRAKPLGTPEPQDEEPDEGLKVEDVEGDDIVRGFGS